MLEKLLFVLPVACASIACTASCSHEPRTESRSSTYVDGVDVAIESNGVKIHVDGSVAYRYESRSSSDGAPSSSATIAGHPFGLRDGVFWLGPREYGAVHEGSLVEIRSSGVAIDGAERGPLPEAAASPAGSERP